MRGACATLLAGLLLGGCGRLPMKDVPDQPIAFVRAQVSDGLLKIDDRRADGRCAAGVGARIS